ncbi:sodium/potassium-transporting ATPase subunit beta-like isoform X2 [Palaemon carinicauda]
MAGSKKKWLIPLLITVLILLIVAVVLIVLFVEGGPPQYKGFEPILPDKRICFDPKNESSYQKYVQVYNKMIEPYEAARLGGDMIDCTLRPPNNEEVCYFRDTWFDDCSKIGHWGFKTSSPCYFLTLDQHREFAVEPYKKTDVLPEEMPKYLRDYIKEDLEDNKELVGLHCSGSDYYKPLPGFLKNFLRPSNSTNYLTPLVAVAFDLNGKDHLDVECTVWSNTTLVNPFPKISFQFQISQNC